MQKLLISLQILLVAAIFSTAATVAQDDPIDDARAFPPTLLNNHETALAQIDWRLQHLKQSREQQLNDLKAAMAEFSKIKAEARKLAETLPMELRFANEKVRAEMISACLRELLSARLEVASNEETILQLSKELEKAKHEGAEIDHLAKEKHQIQIRAIEMKLALTVNEYEQNKKLYEKGAKTKQEMERSRYSLQITEYELAQAKLEMEIENESRTNEIAQRLVEARIEAQPIKARAAAAEKFLKLFSDSNDTFNKIDELNRAYKVIAEYTEEFNRRKWANYDQIAELESLKEMIQSALKKADANSKSEEKNLEEKKSGEK